MAYLHLSASRNAGVIPHSSFLHWRLRDRLGAAGSINVRKSHEGALVRVAPSGVRILDTVFFSLGITLCGASDAGRGNIIASGHSPRGDTLHHPKPHV